MKKRTICGIALMLTIAFLLTACGGKNEGGKDTPYPYAWKENKDGSVTLAIEGTVEEGYVWTTEGSELLEISQAEEGFLITASAEDAAGVAVFTLETEESLPNQAYKITLALEADSKGRLAVQENDNQALEANSTGGENTNALYQWRYDPTQGLLIYVKSTDRTWQLNTETADTENGTALSVIGPSYDDSGFLVTVTGGTAGGTLTLKGAECGLSIALELEQDENGALIVSSHSETAWEQQKSDVSGLTELEELFGTLGVPMGAVLTECSTAVWDDPDEVNATVGMVYFQRNGEEWNLFMANGSDQDTMMEDLVDENAKSKTSEVGGRTVTVWEASGEYTAFWTGETGTVYALSGGGELTVEDMLSAAEDWMEAQHG